MNRIQQRPHAPQEKSAGLTARVESGHFVISPNRDTSRVLFGPKHYEPNYAYPLLVWLHGSGSDERELVRIMPTISMRNYVAVGPRGLCLTEGVPEHDALEGGISLAGLSGDELSEVGLSGGRMSEGVAPHGQGYAWPQGPQHVQEAERRIFEAIDAAREKFHVAPDRIFLAGFDSGGTMAFRVAMNAPRRFAGVLSLCGAFPRGHAPLGCLDQARQLPVLLALGRDSRRYSPAMACADLRLLHTAGMSVMLRQYPCPQQLSPQMLGDVNRWIMEQITTASQSRAL